MIAWILKRTGPGRRRAAVRCALLAVAVALALPLWGVSAPWLARSLPALSPFTALGAVLALRGAGAVALLALPAALLALARRRCFCRWVCPAGCAQDLASRRLPRKAWWLRLPPLGAWLALASLGAAVVGVPMLLWLDPLAIFSAFFSGVRPGASAAAWLAAAGLPLLLILNFALPKAWCLRLCPLGGLQDLLAEAKDLFLKRQTTTDAPSSLFGRIGAGKRVWPSRPRLGVRPPTQSGSASIPAAPSQVCEASKSFARGRRVALGVGVGAVWAGVTRSAARDEKSAPLRPPGARGEALFTGLCLRCGACLRVCPSRILRPSLKGVAGLFTPQVAFERDYCREGCLACMQACPSGALARLSPKSKKFHRIGLARVDAARCLMAQGRECTSCLSSCPYGALDTTWDAENMVSLPAIDTSKCNGCGACEAACVADPKAIRIRRC